MRADKPNGQHGDQTYWVEWRTRLLVEAGFSAEVSDELARQVEVDLHQLLALVDRGCPPHLAVRILAPLEDPVDPK